MRKKQVNALIERWLVAGKISAEQAEYMTEDVATVTSEESSHRLVSAVMYIGATALSLGALLLIASNWAGLSKGLKLVLTVLLPVIPLIFAYWQLVVKDTGNVLGRAANILGLALVGGSLALIGQIYNLEADMVSFLWTWALLTAPFLFVFRKQENVLFSATLIGVALMFVVFEFLESSNMDNGTELLLFTLVGLVYSYLLYTIGVGLRSISSWSDSGRLLRIGGAGVAAVILFITTFDEYAQEIVGHSYRNQVSWEGLAIIFNLVFVGFLSFALVRAIKFEEYNFAYTIVRFFGLYLLVKYFTLFYSMLDTGLFFILGGVLFIAGGWFLEKKKALLVDYLKQSSPHHL